jgi:RNA polymerase sigma-70 factor (ECF subfamily)
LTKEDKIRIRAIRKGDVQAFEILFKEFYSPLLYYAQSILLSKPDAEEVVQNLFFNLWKNKKRFRIHSAISAYLYKSVYHNSLHVLKKRKSSNKYHNILKNNTVQQVPNPSDLMQYKELQLKINSVLEKLPERCRLIFNLNRYQGLKYSEIAEKLKISHKTVEANMTKALKILRLQLDEFTTLKGR